MEDIIENTKVTQLHQVLGFQIDHWFVYTGGSLYLLAISDVVVHWSVVRDQGYIYIFRL